MSEGVREFADLKTTLIKAKQPETQQPTPQENRPKLDRQGRAYATGKRKNAVARVWIKPGPGRVVVNGKEETVYFARPVLRMILRQPLVAAGRDGQYDIICKVTGGGLSGQAGAVRHGISKALIAFEPNLRPTLKTGGFLTRDARVVERKKYGRPKARRSFQFSVRPPEGAPQLPILQAVKRITTVFLRAARRETGALFCIGVAGGLS